MDAVFLNIKVARSNPSKDGEKMYLRLLDIDAAEVVQISVPTVAAPKVGYEGPATFKDFRIIARKDGGFFTVAEGCTVSK